MKFNWPICFLTTFIVLKFLILPSSADDFWDLPTTQSAAQKVENSPENNNDIWTLDSPDKQSATRGDEDFWSGTGNTSLDSYIEEREILRLAEEARIKAAEEAQRQARLEQQRQKEAEAAEEARRKAELYAKRQQEQRHKKDNSIFGKIAAIGMGAVIANSSSLNSAAKTDFLTNYSQDVLNNDMSMSHTNQWKNNTVQAQKGVSSQGQGSGGVSEKERNKQISRRCKQKSNQYNDGDGQSTPQCQLAIYNQCVADELCTLYPSKCGALRSRVSTSCSILANMGDKLCPVCR